MNNPQTCPKCGGTLPANAPSGVCPKCLMLAGLAADEGDLSGNGNAYQATTPQPPVGGGFIPPVPNDLAALFPQLEILEVLGHGGMGAVYKARQSKLDRIVALKIIRPESADDPAFAERFNREARTLARLNHPHIVAVHDFGEVKLADPQQGGRPRPLYYFLMEYVDGANLRQLMETRSVGPDQALAIIRQICEALQFAHDEGIVHRDIKPENVLVDSRGRVKIADFGLAKLAARSAENFTLTATHQVMGTPRYMAPEQMTGSHHVDHRADIYSLGVVFYELLTGEVPLGQFEPPSKRAPVDARLDGIVLRALAREPERRFQQASEMKSSVDIISSATVIQPAVQSPLPPYGASTIVEREIANAWHWMAGTSDATPDSTPQFPTLLAMLLAVAGCLMVFLPWMDVTILDLDRSESSTSVALVDESEPARTGPAVLAHADYSPASPTHRLALPTEPTQTFLLQAADSASDSAESESLMDNMLELRPGETVTLHGSDVWPGLVASAVFAFVALVVLMLPPRLLSRWDWNLPLVILSGVTLLMPALFWMEVDHCFVSRPVPLPPTAPPAVQAPSANVDTPRQVGSVLVQHSEGVVTDGDWVPLNDVAHRITYRHGFYGSVGLGLCLLVLSARGVRRGISEPSTNGPQRVHTGSPVARLRFVTAAREDIGNQIVPHFESHGYRLHERGPDRWVFHRGSKMAGLFATDIRVYETQLSVRTSPAQPGQQWVTCLWEIRTLGAVITQRDVAQLEDEGRELESILRASMPTPSPTAAFPESTSTRPLDSAVAAAGVAAASVSSGSSLSGLQLSSDAGAGVDLEEVRSEVDGPSLAMMAIGVMMMIAHAIMAYIAATQPREPEFALLAIPGIVTGLGMVVGGFNLRGLRSRGWSQLGVISGFIPFSPGWLIGCPISVWTSMVMHRPQVMAGFTEQRRHRARLASLPAQPRYSRKAIVGAVWAGLFVLFALPAFAMNFVAMPATEASPQVELRMVFLLGLPILLAPIGTTILGCMAIGDIRHANGRIYGMGLAVTDALLFPLVLLNGALFAAFMYFNIEVLNMRELGLAVFISLGSTVAFGTGISAAIVQKVWKNENRSDISPKVRL